MTYYLLSIRGWLSIDNKGKRPVYSLSNEREAINMALRILCLLDKVSWCELNTKLSNFPRLRKF